MLSSLSTNDPVNRESISNISNSILISRPSTFSRLDRTRSHDSLIQPHINTINNKNHDQERENKPKPLSHEKDWKWKLQYFLYDIQFPGISRPIDIINTQNRSIYINSELPKNDYKHVEYPRNKIRTTKYTPLSFIPKNLIYQFHNVANLYFLFGIILGFFALFGVDGPVLAAVPLIVIVAITGIKDALEDSRRTISDTEVNNTSVYILQGILNQNVEEDKVSLWRKFKKATTRFMIKLLRLSTSIFKKSSYPNKSTKYRRAPGSIINEKENGIELMRMNTITSLKGIDSELNSSQTLMVPHAYAYDQFQPPDDYNMDDVNRIQLKRSKSKSKSKTTTTPAAAAEIKFKRDYWKNIKVGDILLINNNNEIPADLLILSCNDTEGTCYTETKNLDGESNLKPRQSMKCFEKKINHIQGIKYLKFWIECEGAKPDLYSFKGVLKWVNNINGNLNSNDINAEKVSAEPIGIDNLLLRGSTLRNTKWVIGVVLFTGSETKIMLNSGITPSKRSRITRELNFSIITNFFVLFILCLVSGIVNGKYYARTDTSGIYFDSKSYGGTPIKNGVIAFFVGINLYQTLVPISLYISIEIIKTFQAWLIYSDVLMYYKNLDYPCTPKTWNISDDLGQIEYIFSDKTGTLTQNIMEFKKCTINGTPYGLAYSDATAGLRKRKGIDIINESNEMKIAIETDKKEMINILREMNPDQYVNNSSFESNLTFVSSDFTRALSGDKGLIKQKDVLKFMISLALCHSVVTASDPKNPENLIYKAQSPDEEALVTTAKNVGISYLGKTRDIIQLSIQGEKKSFKILETLQFNSTRKRMSVIVEIPTDNNDVLKSNEKIIKVITKGADNVIFERLSINNSTEFLAETAMQLEGFASEGLRTLCIAEKTLSIEEYNDWKQIYDSAITSIENREELVEKASSLIEKDLLLLGGTAIEDRLQDGVPRAIELFGEAGIKLWVLTGDKLETAMNIGFSCNLLENEMELFVIKTQDSNSRQEIDNLLTKYLKELDGNLTCSKEDLKRARKDHTTSHPKHAVIIDGDDLQSVISFGLQEKFVLLCKQCRSVLCCRVSPAQKAEVVKMVQSTLDAMTLAIGDGANDVAMIQAADVGVGIAGEEGRQAVMSSDFAIAQFKFLTRLVLVHGRWSYKRLAEMIPLFFYKNFVFTISLFWYSVYNDFDGSYLFEYTYLMLYNLFFTSLPVIFLGVLDQDVSDSVSLLVPQLYKTGILRKEWTQPKFWCYMLDGLYQSVISFFFPYLMYTSGRFVRGDGLSLDHRYWIGIMVGVIASTSCNIYVLLHQNRWDWLSLLIIFLSILVIFFWTGVWTVGTNAGEFYSAASETFSSMSFWCILFLGIVVNILPRFVFDSIRTIYFPKDIDIIREQVKLGKFSKKPIAGYDPFAKDLEYNNNNNNNYNETNTEQNSLLTKEDNKLMVPKRYSKIRRISLMQKLVSVRHRETSVLSPLPEKSTSKSPYEERTSLDRLRTSIELPGITRAHTLVPK